MAGLDTLRGAIDAAWRRTQAAALSTELSHDLMPIVLRLYPEAAPEILALAEPGSFSAAYLLRDHAPVLWRTTPARFLERLRASAGHVPVVSTLARVMDTLAPGDDRAALERLAAEGLAAPGAAEIAPERAVLARLAWSRHAADPSALIDEAMTLAAEDSQALAAAIRHLPAQAWSEHASALAARVDALPDGPGAAWARVALIQRVPMAERWPHVARLFALPLEAREASRVVGALLPHVPFGWLEAKVQAEVAAMSSPREVKAASRRLAPYASPAVLDQLWARAAALPLWARAEVVGCVARHHTSRAAALRAELEGLLERLVGDGADEHGLSPAEVPDGAHPGVLRASPALVDGDALLEPARTSLQARALRILSAVLREVALGDRRLAWTLDWRGIGMGLAPSLRADAVRVAGAAEPRAVALAAVGELAHGFPVAEQHLALAALSRLADRSHVPGRAAALAALRAAAVGESPRAGGSSPEAEALVSEHLAGLAAARPTSAEPTQVAEALAGIALAPPEVWAARLAPLFTRDTLDERALLRLVEALAPAFARLGGAALCEALAAAIGGPPPEPEFARAWARAGTRVALA